MRLYWNSILGRVYCNSKIFCSKKCLISLSGLNPYSWEHWFDWLRRPSNQYQLKCSKWKRLELDTCIKYSQMPLKNVSIRKSLIFIEICHLANGGWNDVSQWHFTELEQVASKYRASNGFEDIRMVGLRTDSCLTVTQDFWKRFWKRFKQV